MRRSGQASLGSVPVSAQTSNWRTPAGGVKVEQPVRPPCAVVMNWFQIGPAPLTPEMLRMGELSALPTQTPVTSCGV